MQYSYIYSIAYNNIYKRERERENKIKNIDDCSPTSKE